MSAPFHSNRADITITTNGAEEKLVGVRVVVRHNEGHNEGRILVGGNVVTEMNVASLVQTGQRQYRVTGDDGVTWDVTTRCRACGG